jgi:type VI secretion system secreted protein Hcp
MSYHAYLSIKGNKQGQFKGEGIHEKRKDKWIAVLAFQMGAQSPRDVATGPGSGKRRHLPVTITKEWGAASPQLWQALTSNETLQSVEIQFTRTTGTGAEQVYETIKLTNAAIAAFGPHVGPLPPGAHRGKRYENLTLEYADQLVTGAGGAPAPLGQVKRFGKWT